MDVVNSITTDQYEPRHAILVYTNRCLPDSDIRAFATIHPVRQDNDSRPTIQAGRLLGQGELEAVLVNLNPARRLSFRDATLLATSAECVVWWRPPLPERVWFNCTDSGLGQSSGVTPHPGLVFAATSRTWHVWAVEGSTRPEADAPMFQAPYYNVNDHGLICCGNADRPKQPTPSNTADFERAFWTSRFTHPNVHRRGRLTRWRGGAGALWQSLLKRRRGTFPQHALVPLDCRLNDLIEALGTDPERLSSVRFAP